MSATARLIREGSIGLIELDNPPVNALAHGLRQGLGHGQAAGAEVKDVGLKQNLFLRSRHGLHQGREVGLTALQQRQFMVWGVSHGS